MRMSSASLVPRPQFEGLGPRLEQRVLIINYDRARASGPRSIFHRRSSMATAKYPTPADLDLQCALCLHSYNDPRILPCFHTFCSKCLEVNCVQSPSAKPPSIYCPKCFDQSELPSSGIDGLPRNMYVQNLQNIQTSAQSAPKCDLCTDDVLALSYCQSCCCFMCDFCGQAHRKQRMTVGHNLVPADSANLTPVPLDQVMPVVPSQPHKYCTTHIDHELTLFCETCETPVCEECKMNNHIDHAFLPLEDANLQYTEILQGLVQKTKPLVAQLNESMKNIEFLLSNIQERAEVVADEICDSIDTQMRALHEHKRFLLSRLHAIKMKKENTLEHQLEEVKKIVDEVTVGCSEATKALRHGQASGMFTTNAPLVSRLEQLVNSKHNYAPQEDDCIRFCPSQPAGQIRGYGVCGVLYDRGPSSAHCVVNGEGLFVAKQRKSAAFVLTVMDRYDERRAIGGDKVEANVQSSDGSFVKTTVTDRGDGDYHISYTPEVCGEHRISVLVENKHVKGSPFTVVVYPKGRKHRGIFHCCTFCSSEGKKHVKCGCGGTMPGGYSGCGHGHPGHPGSYHWSCCGATTEKSECTL